MFRILFRFLFRGLFPGNLVPNSPKSREQCSRPTKLAADICNPMEIQPQVPKVGLGAQLRSEGS